MVRTGILLVNLGTPDAPDKGAVRRYLAEFLSDPRVVDLSPIARWLLLNIIILPTRPARSALAYQKVWTKAGSPLLVYSEQLRDAVAKCFPHPQVQVELAMRYGKPSLKAALDRLRKAGCDHIVVFPLYPQFASSSTGSTLEALYQLAGSLWNTPVLSFVPPFYDDPRFIGAFAAVAEPTLAEAKPEHLVFSFHGLPERHINKSDEGTRCLTTDCCAEIGHANRNCYRAQCFATARAIARRLQLNEQEYSVAFQSRLGRSPWIQPHTDKWLRELREQGVKRVAVMCPAFVADCLETLEEIGIGLKEVFERDGGEQLTLVPSLNATPVWVDAVVSILRDHVPQRALAASSEG